MQGQSTTIPQQGSFQGMAIHGGSQAMGPGSSMGTPMGMRGVGAGAIGGQAPGMHGFGQTTNGQGGHCFGGAPGMGMMMGNMNAMGGMGGMGMAMQHFGPQTQGDQFRCSQQPGFGAQALNNMGAMPLGGWNGHMPFMSMLPIAKAGKQQAQPGKRPATGCGPPGHLSGKRHFATQCNCYGHIPIQFKMEVMQRIMPETWNPVTSASKASVDLDSALAIGFDRWPGSPLETRMATGLACTWSLHLTTH
jgi:hypothetical protein